MASKGSILFEVVSSMNPHQNKEILAELRVIVTKLKGSITQLEEGNFAPARDILLQKLKVVLS